MPSIAQVEAQLRANGRPVLLLDTCILLDIIRATMGCLGVRLVDRATQLHAMLTSTPPSCSLVVASMVPTEWNNNASNIANEVRAHLDKIQDQAIHFHEACNSLGIVLGYGRPSYPRANLHTRLRDLSEHILNLAIRLDPDDKCASRAVARVVGNMPPSQRGTEMKDCVIVEEYLEIARQLRASGFTGKCVFCTSNVNDYGNPHPPLASEFAAVNLTFTSNLEWAMHQLTTL
jgi:hypothetical protein